MSYCLKKACKRFAWAIDLQKTKVLAFFVFLITLIEFFEVILIKSNENGLEYYKIIEKSIQHNNDYLFIEHVKVLIEPFSFYETDYEEEYKLYENTIDGIIINDLDTSKDSYYYNYYNYDYSSYYSKNT